MVFCNYFQFVCFPLVTNRKQSKQFLRALKVARPSVVYRNYLSERMLKFLCFFLFILFTYLKSRVYSNTCIFILNICKMLPLRVIIAVSRKGCCGWKSGLWGWVGKNKISVTTLVYKTL